ncbi:rhomboid-related protein 3 isoform X3 [Pyxicephalus adspersus]|uniref:rhomboid-related protein 3 isoform X3 n=1 Tax=Pyxicephalus adspersus TaxID=30357 RepID=UPI003B59919A
MPRVEEQQVDGGSQVEQQVDCGSQVVQQVDCGSQVEQQVDCGCQVEQQVDCGSQVEQKVDCGSQVEQKVDCGSQVEQQVDCGSQVEQIEVPESLEVPANEEHWKCLFHQMSSKRSNSFRRAILQGNRRLCNKALLDEPGLSLTQRLIRHVAYEVLPREIDRKWFYDNYTGCPPPWFMITITIVEVAIFVYYGLVLDRFVLQVTHPLYLKNPLIYHPQLRSQAWRYLSYMFMHAGIEHLGVNVALHLLVGVPLEMVHGTLRIGFVYIAGVLAGSLAVSMADMTAPVVGSSGGVYAIISAHLANIVMNWSGMKCQFKLLRMSFALICMSFEFGRAVWLRFYPSAYPPCPHPSFVAHLGGVLVGITLGVVILRNFEQRLQDQSLWWIFLSSYVLFVTFAILWNIFAFSMPGLRLPPLP